MLNHCTSLLQSALPQHIHNQPSYTTTFSQLLIRSNSHCTVIAGSGLSHDEHSDSTRLALMVRKHGSLVHDEEINDAAWIAARGATMGALKWGAFSALAGGMGYAFSPLYRGLTFQFKVFLQMSGMVLGSMIEADQRLRAHEAMVRHRKKIVRDAEVWRRYEEEYVDEAVARRLADSTKPSSSQKPTD